MLWVEWFLPYEYYDFDNSVLEDSDLCTPGSAKLFDIDSLECHKTYSTERPVNSASISPTQDHVSFASSLWSLYEKKFSKVIFASMSHFRSCSAAARRPWT